MLSGVDRCRCVPIKKLVPLKVVLEAESGGMSAPKGPPTVQTIELIDQATAPAPVQIEGRTRTRTVHAPQRLNL